MSYKRVLPSVSLLLLLLVIAVACTDDDEAEPSATVTITEESVDTAATVTSNAATANAAADGLASQVTSTADESSSVPSATASPTPNDPTSEPTSTVASPTATATPAPTNTPVPPTATPVPPTATPVPPTATPAPPTATPTPEIFSFGEGVVVVGQDVPPGTYRSTGPDDGLFSSCYWERLSGFSGTLDDVIANDFSEYRQVVTIGEGDVGFSSEGCGRWTADLGPITTDPTATFGDGVWIVGVDISPGTWQSETPPDSGCYWERTSGFGGELDDVIGNEFTETQQIVTIAASDTGFRTSGCGVWTLIDG